MVFFTCDECGETMKKKQVLQHNHRCHTTRYSCMDCQTVFDRDSYQTHVKCITEDQKYGGVNHVPKVNKPNCVPATASAHRLLRSYFLSVQCAFDRFCSDCWPSMRCVKHICDRFHAIRGRANADKAMELFWLNVDALASVSDKLCPNCDDRLELVRLLAEQVRLDGCAQNGTNASVDDDDGHNWLDESEDDKKFSPIGGKENDLESLEGHDNTDEQTGSAGCSDVDIKVAERIDGDDTEPVDEVHTANIGVQKADVASKRWRRMFRHKHRRMLVYKPPPTMLWLFNEHWHKQQQQRQQMLLPIRTGQVIRIRTQTRRRRRKEDDEFQQQQMVAGVVVVALQHAASRDRLR
uniref:C2H2-type domain-containing protein n=1 Tax=Globodera pallida TaxID=36090 RepID=A0A183C5G4_GLOPA